MRRATSSPASTSPTTVSTAPTATAASTPDGSVAGYVQPGGNGPRRFVVLPTGTLRTSGDRYCASVRGLPFEPCFNLDRTSQVSFRGSVSGLGFAYCNFVRRSTRADLQPAPTYRLRGVRASAGGED